MRANRSRGNVRIPDVNSMNMPAAYLRAGIAMSPIEMRDIMSDVEMRHVSDVEVRSATAATWMKRRMATAALFPKELRSHWRPLGKWQRRQRQRSLRLSTWHFLLCSAEVTWRRLADSGIRELRCDFSLASRVTNPNL